jgi:hypothetical protein
MRESDPVLLKKFVVFPDDPVDPIKTGPDPPFISQIHFVKVNLQKKGLLSTDGFISTAPATGKKIIRTIRKMDKSINCFSIR